MNANQAIGVSITVIAHDEPEALKAWEVIGRIAVGLVLDGISVSMQAHQIDTDDACGPAA